MTKPAISDSNDRAVMRDGEDDSREDHSAVPVTPVLGAAVNLAIAEIVLRGIADRMRGKVTADMVTTDLKNRKGRKPGPVDGRTLLTTVGLYGASLLAKRSSGGLALVAGGLVAKTLYERGKTIRTRARKQKAAKAKR